MLTATLINISLKDTLQSKNIKFTLKLAGQLLLQAVPVMLILFVLFPRIPGPLWGLPQDANSGMSGLDDNLQFGNISNLTKNSAIAFRVQFKGAVPEQNELYWRGPVLWHQENRSWTMSSNKIGLKTETLEVFGKPIQYTITLEPHNRLWMLMLDMPSLIPNATKLTHDYSVVADKPVRSRMRYDGVSYSRYQLGMHLAERERLLNLQINEGENPKTVQLAKSWRDLKAEDKINSAMQRYRQQPFVYTLRPPILGNNPVDDFLFNTRRGFCEHYATSFVYLMRAAGVPARIVTGYQGGEYNSNGDYYIVRQSDAHAWAEVWLAGKGWVRVDPTAAVSPERIESGISDALDESDELPLMARRDYPWLKKAYLNWDSVNNGWNQWVLGYDDKKQLDFLKKLSGKNLNLQEMLMWMIGIITLIMSLTTYFLIRQQKAKLNPPQRLYALYLKKLKRAGLIPNNGETTLDFAARAAKILPNQQIQIMDIAERYNVTIYSKSPDPDLLQSLAQRIKQLNIPKQ
jgi:transglutaminase-like putative cysteine protease